MRIHKAYIAVVCIICILSLLLAVATPGYAEELPGWREWKSAFLDPSGRVIDTGQGGITHSEGQGMGMLLAASTGDREAFERIWQWTRNNLRVRQDHLFAWRWEEGRGVTDTNNATDGDLFIAWALARAARRFAEPSYAEAARLIAQDIRNRLLVDTAWGLVIMPAAQGFETARGKVVNLSYWVFPALQELDKIDPDPAWSRAIESGLNLLRIARFGRWQLPPDWLLLVDPVIPDPGRPPRFGYDAVRIPLYLYWAGFGDEELLRPYRNYWEFFRTAPFQPAWVRLDDDSVDTHGALPGVLMVRSLILGGRIPKWQQADTIYYSATLGLLTQLAAQEYRNRK